MLSCDWSGVLNEYAEKPQPGALVQDEAHARTRLTLVQDEAHALTSAQAASVGKRQKNGEKRQKTGKLKKIVGARGTIPIPQPTGKTNSSAEEREAHARTRLTLVQDEAHARTHARRARG